jgi:hypothetical protein
MHRIRPLLKGFLSSTITREVDRDPQTVALMVADRL